MRNIPIVPIVPSRKKNNYTYEIVYDKTASDQILVDMRQLKLNNKNVVCIYCGSYSIDCNFYNIHNTKLQNLLITLLNWLLACAMVHNKC